MRFHRGRIAATLFCMAATLVFVQLSWAAPPLQESAPVTVALTTIAADAVEGERMYWSVTIDPHGRRIEEVEIAVPADPASWQVKGDPVIRQVVITEMASFTLSAVPLRPGELWPQVRVRYRLGGQQQATVVNAGTAVRVARLEEPLQAEMVAGTGAVRIGSAWMATLLVRNSSPFTLTGVTLHGMGADLQWEALPSVAKLPPPAAVTLPVTATVKGEHPQPIMMVTYGWQDDAARSRAGRLLVRGQALSVAEIWPHWLEPVRPYVGTVLGFLLGLAASLVTQYVGERRKERQQQRKDQQHVRGLLELCVLETRHAAETTRPVPLEPIEAVYLGERGLYAVAQQLGVHQQMAGLYSEATAYNAGLANPVGASQRLERLKTQTEALDQALRHL